MQNKHCVCCGQGFKPRPQTSHQTYCSNPACQKARKRKWQQEKVRHDPDYADNQARAQRAWNSRNADYWLRYRSAHPDYVEQNRQLQRERHARDKGNVVAKMDASKPASTPPSGKYRMYPITESGIAKMDVWIVELRVISRGFVEPEHVAKR